MMHPTINGKICVADLVVQEFLSCFRHEQECHHHSGRHITVVGWVHKLFGMLAEFCGTTRSACLLENRSTPLYKTEVESHRNISTAQI